MILIAAIIFSLFSSICYGCGVESEPEPKAPEYTREFVEEMIALYEYKMEQANIMAEAARALGYGEEHIVIQFAKQEWAAAHNSKEYFIPYMETFLEEDRLWENRMKEYPTATTIWLYLKNLGYSDAVCAGILGNMMAEVGGGGTLNLKWDAVGGNGWYYGICQWAQGYEEVWYKDLEGQLDFLRDNIKWEIDTFGYAYRKNFDYEAFLALEDYKDVAYAFAVCYERCAEQHRNIRKEYAEKAYEYFVLGVNENDKSF